jgi:hypothetical protein
LTPNELKEINNEWEAVKYGSNLDSSERLWKSIIWPVLIDKNVIPFIVLVMS